MTFRNITKAKLPFSAYVYLYNIPKGKKIGKYLACLLYIFSAFFFLGRFGRTGGRTGGFVSAGDWSSAGNISKVVS